MLSHAVDTYELLCSRFPPLITISQLSEITAIPEKSWRNMLSAGQCPLVALRIGRRVRYRLQDVCAWIDNGGVLSPRRRRGRPRKRETL